MQAPVKMTITPIEATLRVFSDGCVALMVQKKAELEQPLLISSEKESSALGS